LIDCGILAEKHTAPTGGSGRGKLQVQSSVAGDAREFMRKRKIIAAISRSVTILDTTLGDIA